MGFDAVKVFTDYKIAYGKSRGYQTAGNAKGFPLTTWGDAFVFYSVFMAATDPTLAECAGILMKSMSPQGAGRLCSSADPRNPMVFNHTTSFNAAKIAWQNVSPLVKAAALRGVSANTVDGKAVAYLELVNRIAKQERYPYNEQFWSLGSRYAIARSAAGTVPGEFSFAVEAVEDQLGAIGKGLKNLLPSLPNLSLVADIVRWSVIGGVSLAAWWYVVRPLAAMRKKA